MKIPSTRSFSALRTSHLVLLLALGACLGGCSGGDGSASPSGNSGPNNGETVVLPGGTPVVVGDVAGPIRTQIEATILREIDVPADQPEGIVFHAGTNAFYGGATVGGAIYKARLDGTAEVFMPPALDGAGALNLRTSVQGLNVDARDRLYVAGGVSGMLHVYQLPGGASVASFLLPPGAYLNDVAIAPDGDVYVTDSLLPHLYRFTAEQIQAGGGAPQIIVLTPEVAYLDKLRDLNPFEANGIRVTPDGEYVLFVSTNDHTLFRLRELDGTTATPPLSGVSRQLLPVALNGDFGDADGIELVGSNVLYVLDNNGEAINRIDLRNDYREGTITRQARSARFLTPTGLTRAPGNTLLVTNAELFDLSEPLAPYRVVQVPQF